MQIDGLNMLPSHCAHCDKQVRAESRKKGVRLVERVLMSIICAPHRSQAPQSSGKIKGGMMTVKDERGPTLGVLCVLLYFHFVVCLFCD